MIRDARIKDPTFAPWAMTNRQLTESVGELNSKTEIGTNVSKILAKAVKPGGDAMAAYIQLQLTDGTTFSLCINKTTLYTDYFDSEGNTIWTRSI